MNPLNWVNTAGYLLQAVLTVVILGYIVIAAIFILWFLKYLLLSLFLKRPIQNNREKVSIKYLFQRSLVWNDVFGIVYIFLGYALLSFLPDLALRRRLAIVVASVLPYSLGFYRSTGSGIHCGVVGTIFGLLFLDGFPSYQPVSIDHTVYFLLNILVANTSGWLGGFMGLGQIKDSKVLMIFNVRVGKNGQAIDDLVDIIRDVIDKMTGKKFKRVELPSSVSIAQIGPNNLSYRSAILNYERKFQWRYSYAPIKYAITSLFSKTDLSMDTVLDYVSNIMRHMVIDFNVQSKFDDGGCGNFHIGVAAYLETPSIIWVNEDVERRALAVYQQIKKSLLAHEEAPLDSSRWTFLSDGFFITQNWLRSTKLEQYIKNSPSSQETKFFIEKSTLMDQIECGAGILKQFSELPTFFDKIRGNIVVFILFLVGQLGVGIFVSWLYDMVKNVT